MQGAREAGAESATGQSAILEAASALFAEKGFSGTSLSEIAARAGVSKANIYHHFGSKQALYLAVMRAACQCTMGGLDGEPSDAGDPVEALRTFLVRHLEDLLRHPQAGRLVLREMTDSDDTRARALAEEVFSGYASGLVSMVRRAQAEGALRADLDPSLLAFVLLAVNSFFFETRRVLPHIEVARFAQVPGPLVDQVFDLLLHGAQPPEQEQ